MYCILLLSFFLIIYFIDIIRFKRKNKHHIIFIVLLLVDIGMCVYWFTPYSFNIYDEQSAQASVAIRSGDFIDLNDEQKSELLAILQKSKLHRTFIQDTSMPAPIFTVNVHSSGTKLKLFYLYIHDEDEFPSRAQFFDRMEILDFNFNSPYGVYYKISNATEIRNFLEKLKYEE